MIDIPGYKIIEEIGESQKTAVYRAASEKNSKTVIIKTSPDPGLSLSAFKREYDISRNLNLDGIVRIDRMEKFQGGLALIMEDFGAVSLKKILLANAADPARQLRIAVKVAEILGRIHARQIIHGDLKPANILVNLKTGEVKLTGLKHSRDDQADETPQTPFIAGTLAYMSPEQTGRMNRIIDYRTDFYSLGVTFYEMLSGELPFNSNEPIEIIYGHIAKAPHFLSTLDAQIPDVVARIVEKLLAKNPEDRYQSAYGLKSDLEKCLSMLEEHGRIASFPIAENDVAESLNIPHKIYGREREKAMLEQAYDRIARGKSELVVISGAAGAGKTTLIRETFRSTIPQGAFFIEGKYDLISREIPYSAIIRALSGLIQQLLTESPEKLAGWRERLQAALGVNGRIIIDVIPEVELIIGGQPEIAELGPVESKNVFDFVFQAFFKVFTRQEHPLVMFLDDLHSADAASLRMMEMVLTEAESMHFFLVGAYREEEVGKNHPLLASLDGIRKADIAVTACFLGPLGIEEIGTMLSDMLARHPQELHSLAKVIAKKTGGNAFFVNQFITKIHREKLLTFNIKDGCWQWDEEAIGQMGVTDNVTDLLIDRINTLPDDVRDLLSLAACIGSTFPPSLLVEIRKVPLPDVYRALMTAVAEGFLLPLSDAHQRGGLPDTQGMFRFLHDRIQEACYARLGPEKIRQVHLAIGQAMLKKSNRDAIEESLFEIVSHCLKGADLVSEKKDRLELARLTLSAGMKAKSSTAYDQACAYLASGMKLTTDEIWQSDYAFAFALYKERSECEYLAGNHEEAQKLFDLILDKARSNLDRAEIYRIRMALDAKVGRFVEHQTLCIEALRLFNIRLPALSDQAAQQKAIADEILKLKQMVGPRKIADLIDLPRITDPEKMACQRLLMDALSSAYVSNPTFFAIGALTLVNITLTYGVSKDSNYTFVVWAMLLAIKFQNYETAFELGNLALKLNERFQSTSNRCMVPFVIGNFINHWRSPIRHNMTFLREAFASGVEIGDFVYGSFSAMSITRVALSYGHDNLETVLDDIDKSLAFFKRIKNYPAHERQEMVRQTVLNLLGRTESDASLNGDTFNEAAHLEKMQAIRYGTGIALFYLYKAQTLYIAENYTEALEMARQAKNNIAFIASMMQESDCLLFHSLILTALYPDAGQTEKENYLRELQTNQKTMKFWVDNCPENFRGRYLLVEAEIARVTGDFGRACRFYDEALASAGENGFIFLSALAGELAAKSYLACGAVKAAGKYFEDALDLYRRWGAQGKVRRLQNAYNRIIEGSLKEGFTQAARKKTQATSSSLVSSTTEKIADMVDLTSIIKSSQAISGEIHFDRLIEKLMKILIENAGAQTGFMVIDDREKIFISAEDDARIGIRVALQRSGFDESGRNYPQSVIHYVRRTNERIVVNDADAEGLFVADPYIASVRPKSLLCMPIIEQAKTIGILYLENRVLRDAFTTERIHVLEILSSQAAISLKNSINYEEIKKTRDELEESRARLQESFEEYRNLFENIQDTFYRNDMRGNLILVSPSIESMLGYSVGEMLTMNIADLYLNPEDREQFLRLIEQTGYVENFEAQLKRKDGAVIWASANSHYYRNRQGTILGVEGILRDITARKHAEAMLLDEKERLRIMLRSIGDGVIATSLEGKILLTNRIAEQLTGWPQEEALGKSLSSIFNIISESTREPYEDPLNQIRRGGAPELSAQTLLISRDNTERCISESVAPIRDAENKTIGAIVVFRDITEKRKLEKDILKNQKLESIGLFAGGIAHDFNNILTAILANISLAQLYVQPGNKALEKLREAEKASLRAKDLTQQLLTFSKGGNPVKKTASITDLVRESTKFILSGSSIQSKFSLPDDIWPVEVDEGQINQVINNLTINAIQAMPSGGAITIIVRNVRITPEDALPLPEGKYVKISVHDEGIGIPRESLSRIFDPFFTTKQQGSGLGLATTYSIIKKHGGHIDVLSTEGVGTAFFIYLPAAEAGALPAQEPNSEETHRGKGKVLIMDDEESILDIGKEVLNYLGYEVDTALNGRDAIKKYAAAGKAGAPFQAVIMDLTIPGGMGGKEAIQKIKELDPEVRAIVSSGYSNDPVMAHFKQYGFAGVVTKPYRIDDLRKVLQAVIEEG